MVVIGVVLLILFLLLLSPDNLRKVSGAARSGSDQTGTGVHPADLQREGGTDGELRESEGGERRRKPDGREEQTDRQGGKKKNQRGPERATDTAGGRRHTLVNR